MAFALPLSIGSCVIVFGYAASSARVQPDAQNGPAGGIHDFEPRARGCSASSSARWPRS